MVIIKAYNKRVISKSYNTIPERLDSLKEFSMSII